MGLGGWRQSCLGERGGGPARAGRSGWGAGYLIHTRRFQNALNSTTDTNAAKQSVNFRFELMNINVNSNLNHLMDNIVI